MSICNDEDVSDNTRYFIQQYMGLTRVVVVGAAMYLQEWTPPPLVLSLVTSYCPKGNPGFPITFWVETIEERENVTLSMRW